MSSTRRDRNDNLVIRCNSFSGIGTYGMYVYDGTLKQQGMNCSPTNPPNTNENQAGNEWPGSCTDNKNIFVGSGVHFDYYAHYKAEDNSAATVPVCSSPEWKSMHLKICDVKKSSSSCNSYLPGLPAPPPLTPYYEYLDAIGVKTGENNQEITEIKNEIPVVVANTDGGNTQALIATINNLSITGGQLKNILLQSSPLSTDALLTLLNRAVPLLPGNLQIVLTANSPLPYDVLEAVQEMNLPAGTLNVIAAAQQNEPQYPTVEYLEKQIVYLTGENQLLENENIRQKLIHDEKPAAKTELEQTVLTPSKKALAEELIVEEQFTESRAKIDEIVLESTEPDEDAQFADMMKTMVDLKEEGKTIHEMDILKEEKVRTVANSGKIIAAKAQVALELSKEEIYIHPIKKGEQGDENLKMPGITTENTDDFPVINLYPNPNDGNMTLEYSFPGEQDGMLTIYAINGDIVAVYPLKASNHLAFINSGELFSNGVYYYRFSVGDEIIATDKLIILK